MTINGDGFEKQIITNTQSIKDLDRRVSNIEGQKMDPRVVKLETIVNENQKWLRGIGVGVGLLILGMIANIILHVR